jgi:hypothetical protein
MIVLNFSHPFNQSAFLCANCRSAAGRAARANGLLSALFTSGACGGKRSPAFEVVENLDLQKVREKVRQIR